MQSPETQNWSDACHHAVRAATECADWCIQHNGDGDYTDCIRLCLDAADANAAAARLIMREGAHARTMLEAAADVSEACKAMCEGHSGAHGSIDRCAEACGGAADVCNQVAQRLA